MTHLSDDGDDTGFVEPDVEQTFALFRQIGFVPPLHESDGDLPGYTFAGRAEIKLATLRPDEPLGVTSPIPEEAKDFFAKLADFRQEIQVITDPSGTWVFEPGAAPEHMPPPDTPSPRKPWWKVW